LLPFSTSRGQNGAWQKFERGELPILEFYEAFGQELSDTKNGNNSYIRYLKKKGINPGTNAFRFMILKWCFKWIYI